MQKKVPVNIKDSRTQAKNLKKVAAGNSTASIVVLNMDYLLQSRRRPGATAMACVVSDVS